MEWWSGGGFRLSQTHGEAVFDFEALKQIAYQVLWFEERHWEMRPYVDFPKETYTGAHPSAVAKDAYSRGVPMHWKVSYQFDSSTGEQEHSFLLEWNALQNLCGGWDFVPTTDVKVSETQLERARALVQLLQTILGIPNSE